MQIHVQKELHSTDKETNIYKTYLPSDTRIYCAMLYYIFCSSPVYSHRIFYRCFSLNQQLPC